MASDKMSDGFSQLFDSLEVEATNLTPLQPVPDWFEENAYLQANPDVAAALARGELSSGYSHFTMIGLRENRPLFLPGGEPRGQLLLSAPIAMSTSISTDQIRFCIEGVLVSEAGGIMIVGWVDDTAAPLDYVRVGANGWNYVFDESSIFRFRRRDVEASLGSSRIHAFGFVAFTFLNASFGVPFGSTMTVGLKGGGFSSAPFRLRQVDDPEMRRVVLSYIGESEFFGNRQVEVMRILDGPIGNQIINHNLHITRGVVAGVWAERLGRPMRSLRGSIVVCLYGKPEYLFLQNAMFSGLSGFEDYELIYVSNSPEMMERLLKEANAAHHIYGLPLTVVLLPGNAGFSAANNAAINYARSDRILIVNPDVFPKDADWASKHSQVVGNLPANQTRIFGVPLYYDDGTLMHGGMYFEFDKGISLSGNRVLPRQMLRVQHYGKGAPVWASEFTKARPIQSVTGAFISVDRHWYESLGGLSEEYVFGHYEDADLCLKSIKAGTPPWIHDIRLWHLEGKGSVRLPVHEGGSLVNRWLFSDTWSEMVSAGLEGPQPTNAMMLPPQRSMPSSDYVLPASAILEPLATLPTASNAKIVVRKKAGLSQVAKPKLRRSAWKNAQ